ncbi:GDP-mannose 4,6-dehydratase [Paenibacillus phytohabitans]|uniref:GDP-mannose 4,6-dehydratase n=1 Tax=Paenibacillus phytohabitans TaxID=2654978 RepID=UPI003008BB90
MKALITGVNGFVGRHLEQFLLSNDYEVWGSSRSDLDVEENWLNRIQLDFNNVDKLTSVINDLKPDYVFHLAAQSSVKKSWDNIELTLNSNVINSAKLFEAIMRSEIVGNCKVLSVGSSEEYGILPQESMPIKEESNLNPINPYGISKVSQYMLTKLYAKLGLQIVHVRPFNHIGPGQDLGFVVSDFSNQIAKIEANKINPIMNVGNLSAKRDFLDVRDIIRAYVDIISSGISGEVYNICSSKPVAISDLLDTLVSLSSQNIEVKIDPKLLRVVDIPQYVGDNSKIRRLISWQPNISLEETLRDTLDYWRRKGN